MAQNRLVAPDVVVLDGDASFQHQSHWDGYRLSLGGTSHVALTAFLERHPEIRRVNLYMDNDFAGLKNAHKIRDMLRGDPHFKHIRVGINPPRKGKDYNEKLQITLQEIQENHQRRREKQAAISI